MIQPCCTKTAMVQLLLAAASSKSMFSSGLVYENRTYFENSGSNWSKIGSFVDKHHI